jgi:hypothetical protein
MVGCVIAVLCTLGVTSPIAAQQDSTADTTASPGNTLVPLPVLFYQPETGTGFGAAAAYYMYGGAGQSARIVPSSIGLIGIYTTKKQIIAELGAEVYFGAGRRFRLLGAVGYSKFPTKFWGLGNEAPDSLEEDYTPRTFTLAGEFQWEAFLGWYLGASAQLGHRRLSEVQEGGMLAGGAVPGSADGRFVSVGALVTRDTRNNTVAPSRGSYHQLRAAFADGLFGSEFDFGQYTLDLRMYLSPLTRHVLALRALGQAVTGEPPFELLPQLGGDVLLRGYFAGRFRDRNLVAFQAEYRVPVWWRIGVVGFVGAGQVASVRDAFTLDGFKPSAGLGLRFALSPSAGLNIRADYGWGFDVGSGGFYLAFGEAF